MSEVEININNYKYLVGVDDSGNVYAKKYNEKYKIWVIIKFSDVKNESLIEDLLENLKEVYLNQIFKDKK